MDSSTIEKVDYAIFLKDVSRVRNNHSPRVISALIFVLIFFSLSLSVQAQGPGHGTATINTDLEIKLDTEQVLGHIYEADISHLDLSSEANAREMFDQLNSTSCNIFLRWSDKKIEIIIKPDPIHDGWTVAKWNEHFEEKAKLINKN